MPAMSKGRFHWGVQRNKHWKSLIKNKAGCRVEKETKKRKKKVRP